MSCTCRLCVAMEYGRYEIAEAELRERIAQDSENGTLYGRLASALFFQDKDQEALEAAELGVHFAPYSTFCIYWLAECLVVLDRLDEAATATRDGLEQDPEDVDLWTLLSRIHLLRDEHEDTILSADEALAIDAENEHALALRLEALICFDSDSLMADEALTELKRQAPNESDTHRLDAMLHWNREQREPAKQACLTALEIDPVDLDALRLLLDLELDAKTKLGIATQLEDLGCMDFEIAFERVHALRELGFDQDAVDTLH
ncbi:MAG: hypothetical protein AAF497_22245, partial [Planctomycetota bacterium]